MYSITWIEGNKLHSITTPNEEVAIEVFSAMWYTNHNVRLWDKNKHLIC